MTQEKGSDGAGGRGFFNIRAPLIAWIVAVAFFMETLDATVIVTALPKIALAFGVDPIDASIGVTAYLLALGVALPASGWIADRFGPRNVFAGAILMFTATSVLCALSSNLFLFAAARALQGAAGALMSPVGRLVVLRKTPKDRVIEAIGLITWPGLIGPVLGPPLGGFIAQYWGWQWIFLINVPLGLLGFALVMRFISNERAPEQRAFDWASFLLLGAGLSSVLFAMDTLGQRASVVPVGLALAGLVLGYFAWRRMMRVSEPLLRLDTLKTPSFFVANITGGGLTRIVMMATPFLAPLLFQIGFGLDAAQAGLMVLPYFLGNLLMKLVTTPLLRRFGFWRILVVTASLNAALLGALAVMPAPQSQPLIWAFIVVLFAAGLSRSMGMTGMATLTFADIPRERMTDANTLSSVFWQLSQALGVALASLLLRAAMLSRGGTSVNTGDFRFAFGALAAMCFVAAIAYARMKRDAGVALMTKS